MEQISTLKLAMIYDVCEKYNAAYFIKSFPADAMWTKPRFNGNEIMWATTHIGNKKVDIVCYKEGVFCDVTAENEMQLPTTLPKHFLMTDTTRISLSCEVDYVCSDPYDFEKLDVNEVDKLIASMKRVLWDTTYANESGRLVNADVFRIRHRKSDNRLHFYDMSGTEIRTSTPVVNREKFANGYVKYVTEGHTYHLTTI
jgi:hypothetical protein